MRLIKPVKIQDLVDFSGPLIKDHLGDLNQEIMNFSGLSGASEQSFGFIISEKMLKTVDASPLTCVLAPLKIKEQVTSLNSTKTWLFSPNPELCARNIKNQFVFATPFRPDHSGIHPTSVIHESAQLGTNVTVAPFAIIEKNVQIGDDSYIGSHSVIEENVIIKKNVTIHPHVYIGHSCEIGNDCEIMPQAVIGSEGYGYSHDHLGNHYRMPHTGKVILHDDVHIGAGTAIDRGTISDSVIGKGTKIDNQCHLAHNSVVGKNGLLTAQLVTAGSSTLGDNFICGGKTAVTGHIKVTDNVHVSGFSAITNDVKKPGQYGGYPLLPLKQSLKVKASSTHLPELRKQMNRVLRKLFPEDFK